MTPTASSIGRSPRAPAPDWSSKIIGRLGKSPPRRLSRSVRPQLVCRRKVSAAPPSAPSTVSCLLQAHGIGRHARPYRSGRAPGALAGSADEARAHLGDSFAEVLLPDQGPPGLRLGPASLADEFRDEGYRDLTAG